MILIRIPKFTFVFLGKDETKRFQVADLGMERPKPLSWRDRRLAPALVGPSTITAAEQRPNKPTPPLLNDAQKRSSSDDRDEKKEEEEEGKISLHHKRGP